MYLGEYTNKRSNNLSFLKFIAALLVILCHAFPLSMGEQNTDFISEYTHSTMSFGSIAVGVFFISSGYLVTKSIMKHKSTKQYLLARIKRIFPPLIVTIILSVLILGLFASNLSIISYFKNKQTWFYLLNILLIPVHNLPGVFENNVYKSVVNGALWTLPVEFACYIFLLILYKTELLERHTKVLVTLLFISFIGIFMVNIPILMVLRNFVEPVYLFFIASAMYIYKDKIKIDSKYLYLFTILYIILFVLKKGHLANVICLPYIILYISFCLPQIHSKLASLGNYSYGMYLIGFPTQQVIAMYLQGSHAIAMNFLIASIIATIYGVFIYYCVDLNINKIKLY